MSQKIRIVILGGGYGGVEAAKTLYKKYKRRKDIEITLIDKNPYHTLMTELHEIAGSRTEPEAVQVSFHKIFGGKRVKVVIDEITGADFENNVLKSEGAEYHYDYLVIGAGGAPEFFGIPGVQENSFTLWSLEDAIRIRTHVEDRFREAAKEPDPDERRKMLTFTIAGAGFTGIELAGELLERKDTLCPKYHINPREVRVLIIEAMESILPNFSEGPREKAAQRLKKMGGEIMLNSTITGAEEGKVVVGEKTIETDTFIWTAGIHGGEF
ncbi:MAG: NAD(P)/FAD-dependent oxidoreductase, partial [Alkalispirochaetaceae bacterium]